MEHRSQILSRPAVPGGAQCVAPHPPTSARGMRLHDGWSEDFLAQSSLHASCKLRLDRPPQRLARRHGPVLRLLVSLGVAVEGALEISQRDDEAGPAVATALLEEVMLD